ncbi:MAG: FAD-binding oxidoreductase [Hyphomonadaceae bacterium]
MVNEFGIAADFRPRAFLYLAGDELGPADLREEQRLRQHLRIEGLYLDEGELAARGSIRKAGLLHPGSAAADPVKLARGLLHEAVKCAAVIGSPAVAGVYQTTTDRVTIETREGDVIPARTLVLANGYEMPDLVAAARHSLVSSWVIATAPAQATCVPWSDGALVREASGPYLYIRSTADRRIVIGGEDEEFSDPVKRQQMTSQKIEALLAKAAKRCPGISGVTPEFTWTGVLGEADESRPMIGQVLGRPNCLAAVGYGGNGITFSAMAADLLEAELEGRPNEDAALDAPDRD